MLLIDLVTLLLLVLVRLLHVVSGVWVTVLCWHLRLVLRMIIRTILLLILIKLILLMILQRHLLILIVILLPLVLRILLRLWLLWYHTDMLLRLSKLLSSLILILFIFLLFLILFWLFDFCRLLNDLLIKDRLGLCIYQNLLILLHELYLSFKQFIFHG